MTTRYEVKRPYQDIEERAERELDISDARANRHAEGLFVNGWKDKDVLVYAVIDGEFVEMKL